jgi:putative acetyltransferase
MSIAIELLAGPTDEARALIAELDAVLGALYEAEQRHGYSIEQAFQPHVRFFVARRDGEAVGCGAVALSDGYAEVKRMYTRAAARGQGVGGAILGRIEAEARSVGKPVLRLETGTLQGLRGAGAFSASVAVRALSPSTGPRGEGQGEGQNNGAIPI